MNRREVLREQRARRATAHHEAGHAVMAWALGLTVKLASMQQQGDSCGRVEIDVPRWVKRGTWMDPSVRMWAEANIMAQMSGFIFLDWLFARARALMRRRQARLAVTAVARALLRKESVSGRTVARIANRVREVAAR